MRNLDFVDGEFYHIFNRGVDKRTIFQNETDFKDFLESLKKKSKISIIDLSINLNNMQKK